MKSNRFLGVILIVGALILNSCSVQTREVGFGGGSWSMPKSANNALVKNKTIIDSVISIDNLETSEKDLNTVQFKNETDQLFAEKAFSKTTKLRLAKSEITKEKIKSLKRSVSSKDIGRSMGWISICLGLLATFFSGFKLLSIILAIGGVLLGFVGLKIRPGFWGRILCYAGIAISIFSVFSGIIGAIVTLLFLIALILILLILLKKV